MGQPRERGLGGRGVDLLGDRVELVVQVEVLLGEVSFLEATETVDSESPLDEVAISLIVAAKNRVLLYDISKWGEDVGLASKATFSRTKTHLEDTGLIDTEKVPIDVGRPRLRLRFADEDLHDASIDDLLERARSRTA